MSNGRNFWQGNKMQGGRKLTYAQVQDIRTLYAAGSTQGQLCRQFNVGIAQIGRIVRGEVWRDAAGAVGTQKPQERPPLSSAAESQARLLELLAADGFLEKQMPNVAQALKRVPESPLDGGDTPSEASGGLERLAAEAKVRHE